MFLCSSPYVVVNCNKKTSFFEKAAGSNLLQPSGWTPISERLLTASFHHQHDMTVIVTYAPTEIADDQAKNAFFDQLHLVIQQIPPHDMILCLPISMPPSPLLHGTCRQKASSAQNPQIPSPTKTETASCIYAMLGLSIMDTWFPRKNIYKWTWYSPDGRTRKAFDHIIIFSRWKSSVTNCYVYCVAQPSNTDQCLLVAQLRLKLKAVPSPQSFQHYAMGTLPTTSHVPSGSTAGCAGTAMSKDSPLNTPHKQSFTSTRKLPAGDVPRGAPRTRWIDAITRDLQELGLSLSEANPVALDRPKWRSLVNLIGSTHGAAPVTEQYT